MDYFGSCGKQRVGEKEEVDVCGGWGDIGVCMYEGGFDGGGDDCGLGG